MLKKILALPLLLIFLVAIGLIWFYISAQPASGNRATLNDKNFVYFVIPKGESAARIGTKLESSGLIKSALAFKIYIQFTGQSGKLQSGQFKLSPSFSLFQNINALFNGPVEIWTTIPEGLRREEIAVRFATALGKDNAFVTEFMQASKGEEGYLFPDTYKFSKEATPEGSSPFSSFNP